MTGADVGPCRLASPAFLRVAGTASILSAMTTLALIFLPDLYGSVADGLPGRMQRVVDPAYQVRAWTYQAHPFLVFTAVVGIAAACWRSSPAITLSGVLGFGLWALTEAAQQSLTLFAFDDWRRAWLAGDPGVRQSIETLTSVYDALWEAAYSLLLFGIILGSTFFAILFCGMKDRLSKVVGALFAIAAIQSLFLQSAELGGPALPQLLGFWLYPATQPLARLLIGVWLFRAAQSVLRASHLPQAAASEANGRRR